MKTRIYEKGVHNSPKTEFKKGFTPWNSGRTGLTQMSEAKKGSKNPMWGKKGEKSPFYKGGYKLKLFLNRQRKILKKANGGSHTFADWEDLKAQHNWTCVHCGRKPPEIKITEDHIIPLSKGGSNNIDNIQPLCSSCNSKKNNKYEPKI